MAQNLYKIVTVRNAVFYVAADNPTEARNMVDQQWDEWDYAGSGEAKTIELLAVMSHYPPETNATERLPWFLNGKKIGD